MFQGTGSDVGKSTLVAGLCRLARRRGIRVAPFKPQNMSNNAAACADGGEIGRAQALQARACHLQPCVDFNPVLLKPQSDSTAQVVVHGKVIDTLSASEYMNDRRQYLMQAVVDSFTRLSDQYDLVLVEDAGSAAEVNLRERDITNMGFAQRMQVPEAESPASAVATSFWVNRNTTRMAWMERPARQRRWGYWISSRSCSLRNRFGRFMASALAATPLYPAMKSISVTVKVRTHAAR